MSGEISSTIKDELYIDVVSRTIITALSKEIASLLETRINAQIDDILLPGLRTLIQSLVKAETDRLDKKITELGETARFLIPHSSHDLLNQLTNTMNDRYKGEDRHIADITEELKNIRNEIASTKDGPKELYGRLTSLTENISLALNQKMDESSVQIQKRIASIEEKVKSIVHDSSTDVIKHLAGNVENLLTGQEGTGKALKKELFSFMQAWEESARRQEDVAKNFKEQHLAQMKSLIEASLASMTQTFFPVESSLRQMILDAGTTITKEVNSSVKAETDRLEQKIPDAQSTVLGLNRKMDESILEIKEQISEALSSLTQAVETRARGQEETGETAKDVHRTDMQNILEASLSTMAQIESLLQQLLHDTNASTIKQTTLNLEKHLKREIDYKLTFLKEFSALKQALETNKPSITKELLEIKQDIQKANEDHTALLRMVIALLEKQSPLE